MDAFLQLAAIASPNFASTTGITMQQIAANATSTLVTLAVPPLSFVEQNGPSIAAYIAMALVIGIMLGFAIIWGRLLDW